MSKAKVILGLLEYKLLKLTGASKLFDDEWYMHEYPHVKNWNKERLLHYIYHGKNEGLRPNPLICPKWTKDQQYGRILKILRVNPLWIVSLLGDWISPHPVLSTRNKAKEKNYSSPLKSGRESTDLICRRRGIINLFDQEWYINNYNCYYKGKKVGPLYHFLVSGWKTGFDPSPLISIGYINMVSDDSDGLDPLSNYIISITKKHDNKPDNHGLVIHRINNVVERIKKIYVNTPSLSELNEALQKINLIDDAEKRRIVFTVRDNKAEEEFLSFLDQNNYNQNIISEDISTIKKEIEKNSWYKTVYNAFKIIGVSVVIEEDDNCFDHELYSCMRRKNIDLKGIIKCTDETALIEYKHGNRSNNIIEKGIDLTGYADKNYFHFMVDIAPKVIMSNILINEREIPFVVNNSMPSAFVDIIRILDEKSRDIVWLDNENGYKFRKLICLPKTYRLYNMYTSKYKEVNQ